MGSGTEQAALWGPARATGRLHEPMWHAVLRGRGSTATASLRHGTVDVGCGGGFALRCRPTRCDRVVWTRTAELLDIPASECRRPTRDRDLEDPRL